MLKSKLRLPAKAKLSRSSAYKSLSFKLMIIKNNLAFSRFGFIIGKKIDKRAVVRNRTKRILRSCIEEMLQKINAGYDMLFIIQKNAVGQKREFIFNELEKLFLNLKLLK